MPTEGLQLFHGSNIIQLKNELAIELASATKVNNLLASENKVIDHLITRMD
jgi:hypothetical protein